MDKSYVQYFKTHKRAIIKRSHLERKYLKNRTAVSLKTCKKNSPRIYNRFSKKGHKKFLNNLVYFTTLSDNKKMIKNQRDVQKSII